MAFTTQITLFAAVRFDHVLGQHRLVAVQTKPVQLVCTQTPLSPSGWEVQDVTGGLPVELFQVDHNSAGSAQVGSIALNLGPVPNLNADIFVNNTAVVVTIQIPGTSGDGTPNLHLLTVHLRALPSLDLLQVAGGSTVLGTGGANPLRASGNPASTAGGLFPAWTTIVWSSPLAGVAFAPAGAGLSKTITGLVGDIPLHLSTAAPPPTPNVGCSFDGTLSFPLLGSTKTVSCGDSALSLVADVTPPTITFNGLDLEVGVSTTASRTVAFQTVVQDLGYFSLDNVTFTFSWVLRNAQAADIVVNTVYGMSGGSWALISGAVPVDVNVTVPAPTVAAAHRPPINHAAWGGQYAGAERSTTLATWGNGTPAGNVRVELQNGRYERFTVTVSATDHAGNLATEPRTVLITIPTDIVLALDYSGSMASPPGGGGVAGPGVESKWDAAKDAANRFHAIYRAIAPSLGGGDALNHQVGYVRFWWDDATAADATTAVQPMVNVGDVPAGTLVADADPAWLQFTPIGEGLKRAGAQLASNSGWRRRVIIAMTDGYENRGSTIAAVRAAASGPDFLPNTANDKQNGLIINSCAFGLDSGLDADKMDWLATGSDGGKGYSGTFHTTATAVGATANKALTNNFLNMLVDSLPSVEKTMPIPLNESPPASGNFVGTATIEAGVSRAVLMITSDGAASLSGPTAGTVGSAAGVKWWVINNPSAGNYTVTFTGAGPSGAVELHGIFDLQLRSEFTVVGPGVVGSVLTLRARISDGGRPVSGVAVSAKVVTPGRSDGDVAARYSKVMLARQGKFRVPALKTGPDATSVREALVSAATKYFKLPTVRHLNDGSIILREVASEPGLYEAQVTNTSHEGSYGFEFEARGAMVDGSPFTRGYGVNRYLRAVADPQLSTVEWVPGPLRDGTVNWVLHVTPVSTSGFAMGGGQQYSVQLGGRKEPISLRDGLTGMYSAEVRLEAGIQPPVVQLINASDKVELVSARDSSRPKRVRITLEAVQIKDGKESFGDPGEFHFESVVAPQGDGSRAVRSRFPEEKVIRLVEDKVYRIEHLIFDGYVEDSAALVIAIGATEHDWTRKGDRLDPLARYRRTLVGAVDTWAGNYVPGDEKRDPEELSDWNVWLRVDVL